MSVYDRSSPMNDILVRGEEARRRRSKKRRLQPEEITVDPSVRLRPHESIVEEVPYGNWFKEMMSYPCQKELTMLETFTALSAATVYLPISLLLLLFPVESCTLNDDMTLRQCTDAKGFIRITGINVCCIVFLYVIFCRASSRKPTSGIILGTLLSRTIYAVSAMYLLYIRRFIPIDNLYQAIAIDCGLAFASYGFWLFQSGNVTSKKFFQSVWQLIRPSNALVYKSSIAVHILGFIQSILSLCFFTFPTIAFQMLQINPLEFYNFSKGAFCMGFMSSAAIGFIHVLAGGADCRSLSLAAVFYRVLFTMPVIAYIGAIGQIPLGLALYYIGLDGVFALSVFIILCIESKKVKCQ